MHSSTEREGVNWASRHIKAKGCRFYWHSGMRRSPKNAKRRTLRTHRLGR